MEDRNHHRKSRIYVEGNNLGLDADGSSEDFSFNTDLNSDHERVTGNPDGENDQRYLIHSPKSNPLMDK